MKNIDLAKGPKKKNEIQSPGSGKSTSTSTRLKLLFLIFMCVVVSFSAAVITSRPFINRVKSLENMLDLFDERLNRLEKMGDKLALLDEQRTRFEISLMNRIESLEALRHIKNTEGDEDLNNLHTEAKPDGRSEILGEEPVLRETDKTRFHQVQPGETLYRISLNYRLTVDELKSMNNIGPESVIIIGQKLKISQD
ncbi:MAG: LysM peptidoglycan-binding domain-containing protein [Deltaproteobacteria bacterium]|nr:LysM peptidoglycan-binding domain-containing protein [Deltaproteobacteria bacterium]